MPIRAMRMLKPIVPPLLWNIGKDFKSRLLRSADHLAYAPEGWSTRLPAGVTSQDYWTAFIAHERSECERLIARVRGDERSLTLAGDETLKHVTFGYVLALAARNQQRVTVLDYGGNLGDYYWLGRALVPGVDLDYHCKELPQLAAAGRLISPDVTWHTDDACLAHSHDLVMFSSSIQYLPDWQDILLRAGQSAGRYLFLSDVPTVRDVPAYVATHRSRGHTHLQVQLNRSEIIATAEQAGLRLVREFEMGAHPRVANAPEQPRCLGWLFQRNPD